MRPTPPALPSPGAGAAPPPSRTLVFVCNEVEFHVRVNPGKVELVLPDRTLVLPRVPAASGAKYQEGRTVFWNQGNEARFEIDGKDYPAASADPAESLRHEPVREKETCKKRQR